MIKKEKKEPYIEVAFSYRIKESEEKEGNEYASGLLFERKVFDNKDFKYIERCVNGLKRGFLISLKDKFNDIIKGGD